MKTNLTSKFERENAIIKLSRTSNKIRTEVNTIQREQDEHRSLPTGAIHLSVARFYKI